MARLYERPLREGVRWGPMADRTGRWVHLDDRRPWQHPAMNHEELRAAFTELGAADPEEWAASQTEEDINQLGRFLFLKGGWQAVVDDDDTSWIDRLVVETPEDRVQPFDGIAHALRNLLAAGADPNDLNQLVRGMQADALFQFCYLLDDSSVVDGNTYQDWGLFEVDEDGQPLAPIDGLHESVLETDPTGREMRPRTIP